MIVTAFGRILENNEVDGLSKEEFFEFNENGERQLELDRIQKFLESFWGEKSSYIYDVLNKVYKCYFYEAKEKFDLGEKGRQQQLSLF